MRLLLDTHALIWWWLGDPSLPARGAALLSSGGAEVLVSPVAAIEIGTKVRKGQLPALAEPLAHFDELVFQDGFAHLPVTSAHAREAGLLAGQHGDPFDRLIAAQALIEDITVLTRDPAIAAFGCKVLW